MLQSGQKVLDDSGIFIRDFPSPIFNVDDPHYTVERNIETGGGKWEFYSETKNLG